MFRRRMSHGMLAVWALVVMLRASAIAADAQEQSSLPPIGTKSAATMQVNALNKAQPDECFDAIGSPHNQYPAVMPCAHGVPKVNQGYVFGMTNAGSNLWYGTSANQLCTVLASVFVRAGISPIPFQSGDLVCEFSKSNFLLTHPTVPPALGDWRPAQILRMNRKNNLITEMTPSDPLLEQTLGIRAAGAVNNIVLLAGPVLAPFGSPAPGINLFAFRNSTGEYLGSHTLSQYADIRTFVRYKGVLYAGVQNADGSGSVLRWRGNAASPFLFDEVGHVDSDAAYVAVHRNRIYAGTWGGLSSPSHKLSGVWASPPIPPNGLTTAHANLWTEIWRVDQYEPDPVTAQTIMTGALQSYRGSLYWGTMQVPITGALANVMVYPRIPGPADLVQTVIGTIRPTAIFRCRGASIKNRAPVLLYGETVLPVYTAGLGWQMLQNQMNAEPQFGASGFGNPFNGYAWTMANYRGRLYVGTFDWSYVASDLVSALLPVFKITDPATINTIQSAFDRYLVSEGANFGADLWYFAGNEAALNETRYGAGNYLNYGFRTMVPDGRLFLGTANPMNLATNPARTPLLGGFELLGLNP